MRLTEERRKEIRKTLNGYIGGGFLYDERILTHEETRNTLVIADELWDAFAEAEEDAENAQRDLGDALEENARLRAGLVQIHLWGGGREGEVK